VFGENYFGLYLDTWILGYLDTWILGIMGIHHSLRFSCFLYFLHISLARLNSPISTTLAAKQWGNFGDF
jgi:hypothetical protein